MKLHRQSSRHTPCAVRPLCVESPQYTRLCRNIVAGIPCVPEARLGRHAGPKESSGFFKKPSLVRLYALQQRKAQWADGTRSVPATLADGTRSVPATMRRRRGVILLLVLIVIAMLALATGVFGQLMLTHHRAAQMASRQSQARTFAESGAEIARQFLNRLPEDQVADGGLYDNSQRFFDQIVAKDETPRDQGRFTVLAPKIEDTVIDGVRYGLQDESARINLATILNYDKSSGSVSADGDDAADNTNAHAMLMGLPAMTDAIADDILDWVDSERHNPRKQRCRKRLLQQPSTPLRTPQRLARFHRRALAGQRRNPGAALRLRCGEHGL